MGDTDIHLTATCDASKSRVHSCTFETAATLTEHTTASWVAAVSCCEIKKSTIIFGFLAHFDI